MYSKPKLAFKYIRYFLSAYNGKGHGMHSPFVFEFIQKVLNDKTKYAAYDKVALLRKLLLADKTIIQVDDFGAGSSITKSNRRTISSIAKNAAKSKKIGQLLFRIVKYYQPKHILELGTSLGITTSYLALANTNAKLITMEGADAVAKRANDNFKKLNIENIELITGNFDDTLESVIQKTASIDFVFIDGNHRQEPTERYFNILLKKINNDTILIFDDIHWSIEMEAAWHTIKNHPSVRCSIDLFFIGMVFFRQEFKEKQDFAIRF